MAAAAVPGAVQFPVEDSTAAAAAAATKEDEAGMKAGEAVEGEIAATVAADAEAMGEKDALDNALDVALDAPGGESFTDAAAAAVAAPAEIGAPAGGESVAPAAVDDFAPEKLIATSASGKVRSAEKQATNELCKKYLNSTIAPLINAGLAKLAIEQPDDPIEALAKFLELHHPSPKVKPVVFAFGVRGSGKEGACQRLMDEFGWVWLQAGDVLRSEVESNSAAGKVITQCIQKGKTVPAELTVKLVLSAMEHLGNAPGVILDGFPRKLDQAGLFERRAGSQFRGALYFDVPKEVALERCVASARPHTRFDPVKRFEQRWKTFQHHVMPVVEYYKGANKIKSVNAAGHPDDVFAELRDMFAPIFKVPTKKLS